MLKNLVKIIFTFAAVCSIIVAAIWHLESQNFFNLTELSFKTNIGSSLTSEKSEKVILANETSALAEKLKFFKGISLFQVDLEKIQRTIESEGWVKSVEIYREWPSRLKIVIETYDISLLFWQSEKKIYPILENNKILEPLDVTRAPDRAITIEKKIFSEAKIREKAIRLLKSLPSKGSFSSAKIAELGYNSKEGFWTDLLNRDLRVKLGSENFETKSIRVTQVLDYIENKQIEARVIDANLSQKVLVRLRKDP